MSYHPAGHVPVGTGQQTPVTRYPAGVPSHARTAPERVVVVQQVADHHVGAASHHVGARQIPGRAVVVQTPPQGSQARQVPGTETVVFQGRVPRR